MNKIILCSIAILMFTFQVAAEENCNIPFHPDGACEQTGYICNLGFNVNGENSMMFFSLGQDTTCSILLKSTINTKRDTISNVWSDHANFTLIENEQNMSPLSLTLAGSLAMQAVNNGIPVSIIYKRVGMLEFDGIKLLSIRLVQKN